MRPWLSILIPSINPVKLGLFIDSLQKNAISFDGIEFVFDYKKRAKVVSAYNDLILRATADWIWIANDDLMCESFGWDAVFSGATQMFKDQIAMFYPNDKLFEDEFACFPLVNKYVIGELFPMPYRKYKIDDSIMDVIPKERQIYLSQVIMRHSNHITSGNGFRTKTGKIYPIDKIVGMLDSYDYAYLAPKRDLIRRELCSKIAS